MNTYGDILQYFSHNHLGAEYSVMHVGAYEASLLRGGSPKQETIIDRKEWLIAPQDRTTLPPCVSQSSSTSSSWIFHVGASWAIGARYREVFGTSHESDALEEMSGKTRVSGVCLHGKLSDQPIRRHRRLIPTGSSYESQSPGSI